ncbi:MAG: hypothetical protein HY516_00120 [Candidatus Aenigmarchaeota archaeon]|nr:hypothetical protein [Candidatus Aenigmarchaeota archaeon]
MRKNGNVSFVVLILVTVVSIGVILYGQKTLGSEKFCSADSDCACGVNTRTKECFYGNEKYVDKNSQCPDFCSGIGGNLGIKCVKNECTQVRMR